MSSVRRYFYHSFPRRSKSGNDKGIEILSSICQNGLLLVPEQVTWTDPTEADGITPILAVQRRACFTELAPEELLEHGKIFGPYAVEFEIDELRNLGALPVIYVPDKLESDEYCGAIGTLLLASLTSSATLIKNIAETVASQVAALQVKLDFRNGRQVVRNFSANETAVIREYLDLLQQAEGITFNDTRNALLSMSSLFYPTENKKYTDDLAYYRQREWRVISGAFLRGKPTTKVTTQLQAKELVTLDQEFFSKRLRFADGEFSIAEKCHYLKRLRARHVLEFARQIIVPGGKVDEATRLVRSYGFKLPVSEGATNQISRGSGAG